MKVFEPSFGNRAGYYLWYGNEIKHISDPLGYRDDRQVRSRDENMNGIIRTTSDDLKFYRGVDDGYVNNDGGYDFLRSIIQRGISEEVYLVKTYKFNGVVKEEYRCFLDLLTAESVQEENGNLYYTVKSKDNGIDPIILARKSEDVEITRSTTIDGKAITEEIPFEYVKIKDRKFQIICSQKALEESAITDQIVFTIPTDLEYTRTDSFVAVTGTSVGGASSFFYAEAEDDYIATLTLDYRLRMDLIKNTTSYSIYLREYSYNDSTEEYDLENSVFLDNGTALVAGIIEGNVSQLFSIVKGRFYAIEISTPSLLEGDDKSIYPLEWKIGLDYSQSFQETYTVAYKAKDLVNRLVYIYTGQNNIVKSDFFDTIGELFYITDGGSLRGIPREVSDKTLRTWALTTNLEDFLASFDATWGLGSGIERVGRKEYFRIEPKKYFYDNFVSLDLGKLSKIKRYPAIDYIYSGINIGFDNSVSVDGVYGLEKIHGLVSRVTYITQQSNVYEKISTYQMDDYLIKQLRMEQYTYDPTVDNDNDEVKFFLDCKWEEGELVQRDVLDDLVEVPTGIYDAENLKGARWTPLACLLRHGNWIRGCLTDNLGSLLSFGASDDKTQMVYKLKPDDNYNYLDGVEYQESDSIFATYLEKELFYPEFIEGELDITESDLQTLDNNPYKRVKFTDEFGEEDSGFQIEVSPEGRGSVKLLRYRNKPTKEYGEYNNDYSLDYV